MTPACVRFYARLFSLFWAKSIVDVVRILLDHNADIEAETSKGETPLHYVTSAAVAYANHSRDPKEIYAKEKLLDVARVEACFWARDSIKLLLDRGANHRAINKQGQTPVDIANHINYSTITRFITNYSGQVKARARSEDPTKLRKKMKK
jgi:ankyrin repeat protein